MKKDKSLTMLIIPFEDLNKLDLKQIKWQYISDITSCNTDEEKENEWNEQIKPFFGTKLKRNLCVERNV